MFSQQQFIPRFQSLIEDQKHNSNYHKALDPNTSSRPSSCHPNNHPIMTYQYPAESLPLQWNSASISTPSYYEQFDPTWATQDPCADLDYWREASSPSEPQGIFILTSAGLMGSLRRGNAISFGIWLGQPITNNKQQSNDQVPHHAFKKFLIPRLYSSARSKDQHRWQ